MVPLFFSSAERRFSMRDGRRQVEPRPSREEQPVPPAPCPRGAGAGPVHSDGRSASDRHRGSAGCSTAPPPCTAMQLRIPGLRYAVRCVLLSSAGKGGRFTAQKLQVLTERTKAPQSAPAAAPRSQPGTGTGSTAISAQHRHRQHRDLSPAQAPAAPRSQPGTGTGSTAISAQHRHRQHRDLSPAQAPAAPRSQPGTGTGSTAISARHRHGRTRCCGRCNGCSPVGGRPWCTQPGAFRNKRERVGIGTGGCKK
ncbi:uncharacterized protein [Patagioenas fasciata]|uniref:uncharacterized protein isoform X2 n=2 Tax=Patagioenas fasciata TaxID=372321 RepID=UPI003A996A74